MSDEIRVSCFTNLDEFKNAEWPSRMLCRPVVGDNVEGHRGDTGPGCRPVLRVVAVTHCFDCRGELFLRVELHR